MRCRLVNAVDGKSFYLDVEANYDNGPEILVTVIDSTTKDNLVELYVDNHQDASDLFVAVFAAFQKFLVLKG